MSVTAVSPAYAQASTHHQEHLMKNPTVLQFVPTTHQMNWSRDVTIDGESAILTRYERKDGRNNNIGGEHFSSVITINGTLKGFANVSLDLVSASLPSAERSKEIALDFLKNYAPELIPRMKISWVKPHDETIRVERDGRDEVETLTGMKVKARNLADGLWFWVIIGADESVMIFERDVTWVNFPGHRKTEKWLHDSWLKEQI